MDALNFENKDLKNYWLLLKHLSMEAKLELASLLINSIKNNNPKKSETDEEILDRLNGAWADDGESAEELIEVIRKSRVSTRQIEPLD